MCDASGPPLRYQEYTHRVHMAQCPYRAYLATMTPAQFRAALKALNLSQRRLALTLRLDPKTTNRWARGTSPIPESVAQLLACWRSRPPA